MSLQTFNLHDFKSLPFCIGTLLGIGMILGLIFWQGRAFFKRMELEDRGEWDRPLPQFVRSYWGIACDSLFIGGISLTGVRMQTAVDESGIRCTFYVNVRSS